jgi:hypothetical protein
MEVPFVGCCRYLNLGRAVRCCKGICSAPSALRQALQHLLHDAVAVRAAELEHVALGEVDVLPATRAA